MNTTLIIYFLSIFSILTASFTSFFIASHYRKWTNLSKPSSCDNCGKPISKFALIPVFGSLFNLFKCPACNKKYSAKMCVIELFSILFFIGLTFLSLDSGFISFNEDLGITFLKFLILSLASSLFALFAYEDWENKEITDIYIFSAFILFAYIFPENIKMGAFLLAGTFIFKMIADNIATIIKKEETTAIGEGDILLFAFIGLLIPLELIPFAFILMGSCAIIMTYFSKEKTGPLAPNLFFGLTILIFYINFINLQGI